MIKVKIFDKKDDAYINHRNIIIVMDQGDRLFITMNNGAKYTIKGTIEELMNQITEYEKNIPYIQYTIKEGETDE